MKAEANLHFLQGVNQLIGHGWPYSPESSEYPGWRFYAAGVFNDNNPWWIVMPDLARYLQRASYMLRQGKPAADVAVYLPISDAYAEFSPGRANLIEGLRNRIGSDVIASILDAGFSFDFFDDDTLKKIGKVEKGALTLGSNRYRIVILPNVKRIPMDTYRTLAEFSHSGGALIASRRQPTLAPGFASAAAESKEILQVSQSLFSSSQQAQFIDDETKLSTLLRGMQPDISLSPATQEIGFLHRRTDDADIYFLANTSNVRKKARALFRPVNTSAEWWDPMSGRITHAMVSVDKMASVDIDLEPYAGKFLVFSNKLGSQTQMAANSEETASLDISGGWRVTFGKSGITKTMDPLNSWSDDEATRYFSGVAVYEKNITVPEGMMKPGLALQLDFGPGRAEPESRRVNGMQAWFDAPVREAAEVYINDQRAGSVWCPPYTLDVTRWIKQGENRIKVLVGNTAINHMGGRSLPDYRLLNQLYGKRFDPQDADKIQPIASGLLGPIRLLVMK
jgi:hypothetical protein